MANSFPGPAVARSATGQLLAQGPPGLKGDQGLPGPKGDTGATGPAGSFFAAVSVSGGGSITLTANQRAFVDASAGPCTVNSPALAGGACFAVCDGKKGGSFSAADYAKIPNASSNIEDPNNPGVYSTNPIELTQPSSDVVWQADPAGTFWKVVSG